MIINVIGWQNVDFTDATGRVIKGKTAYFNVPIDNNGIGMRADKQFVYDNIFGNNKMEVGKYDFEYGPRGRLISLKKV